MLIVLLAKLTWPLVLKAIGLMVSVAFSVFVSMVIDECSEDTVRHE